MKRTWRSGIFGVYKFYRENVKNCRTVPEKCTTGSGVRINSTKIPSKFLRKNTKSGGKTRKLHIFENCYCEFEVLGSLQYTSLRDWNTVADQKSSGKSLDN